MLNMPEIYVLYDNLWHFTGRKRVLEAFNASKEILINNFTLCYCHK